MSAICERKEKGITQEQLAEILNVSGRTVSRWETGNNMPDISILVDIADYYDISIPEIISGERKSEIMWNAEIDLYDGLDSNPFAQKLKAVNQEIYRSDNDTECVDLLPELYREREDF